MRRQDSSRDARREINLLVSKVSEKMNHPQITQITQIECLPARRTHFGADPTRAGLWPGTTAHEGRMKDPALLNQPTGGFSFGPRTLLLSPGVARRRESSVHLRNLCHLRLP